MSNNFNLKYCLKCVIPETRPHTEIDSDGICSACKYFEERKQIDWDKRKKALVNILEKYREKNKNFYDCIVPSSGGKDSTYQAIKIRELGGNPLILTVTTDMLTPLGRKNIENLKHLGFDYLEYTPNPEFRKKVNKFSLETIGDISYAEELTVHCSVPRFAIKLNIPLVIWGENPGNENGGPEAHAADREILTLEKHDDDWFEEFGCHGGLRSTDLLNYWPGLKFNKKDLLPYTFPSKDELKKIGYFGIFLGQYIPWDGHNNATHAKKNGFTEYDKWVEGNIVNYENLDNYQMRIHDYFKFLKYGYDRVSDWGSLAIRRKRYTRKQVVDLTKEYGGKYPESYLGMKLNKILEYIDMTEDEFKIVCEKFTNKKLFKKNPDGSLFYDNTGSLIKNNYDNVI